MLVPLRSAMQEACEAARPQVGLRRIRLRMLLAMLLRQVLTRRPHCRGAHLRNMLSWEHWLVVCVAKRSG